MIGVPKIRQLGGTNDNFLCKRRQNIGHQRQYSSETPSVQKWNSPPRGALDRLNSKQIVEPPVW